MYDIIDTYIYTCVHLYMYICIYIHTHTHMFTSDVAGSTCVYLPATAGKGLKKKTSSCYLRFKPRTLRVFL